MIRKFALSVAALLVCVATAVAQQPQVSGKVTGTDGRPIIGVAVIVDGTHVGTQTDAQGQYSLRAPADGALTFTFLGYQSQKVAIAGRAVIDMVLEESSTSLDEVVVVAFGTTTREAFTGSAAVVKSEDLAKRQVSNVAQALAGAAPGIQVTSTSGDPSASPSILVRGIGSINASVDPLIVVDGVPYTASLNSINPADIENVTILKDAASTALYGSRGANGVIMITTKRAKAGKATVTFDAKWGVNMRAQKDYDYIEDPAQYYEAHYSALHNYYLYRGLAPDQAHARANRQLVSGENGGLAYQVFSVPENEWFIGTNGKVNPKATLGNKVTYNGREYTLLPDDYSDEYRNSFRQEYTLNMSAASENASVYASLGYLENQGIVAKSSYERYTGRLRADYQAKKWLKMGANVSFAHSESQTLVNENDTSNGNVFYFMNIMAPIYPLFLRDGNGNIMIDDHGFQIRDYGDGMNAGLTRPFNPNGNPLQDILLNTNEHNGNAFTGTAFADITLCKDLVATFNIGTNFSESMTSRVYNLYYGQWAKSGGSVEKSNTRRFEINAQQLLNYNHVFGEKHRVSIMVGHEFYKRKYYSLSASKSKLFANDNAELNGAIIDDKHAGSYRTDYNNEGYFGRAEYEFDSRIIVSGSYRRDASSRFHPDHRWGNFWSASAAWLINRESWFGAEWVDMLKLKASFGTQGNDGISNWLYTDRYSISENDGDMALGFSSKGNKNITWETNRNFNAGVDFEFFRGRLGGTIEYFNRKTTDMLNYFYVAPSAGYQGYWANIGDMRNSGFEIDLHATPVQTKNFTWNISLNVSHYKNKMTRIADENKTETIEGYQGYTNGSTYIGEGLSYYTWYLKSYAGVDQTTGLSMWYMDEKDDEGNVTGRTTTTDYSSATRYLHETSLPDLFGGFNTSFEFFGVDISASFSYQIGGKSYDSGYASAMASPYSSVSGYNYHKDILQSWTPENPSTTIPRFQYGDEYSVASSDRFLTDASYLSLNNISVGYTLPESFTSKFGVAKLRVYLACDNVYYWAKRDGFDPRYSYSGSTSAYNYSPIRTISGGINIQF